MDVTILVEPKINLDRLSEVLDGLGHEGRVHTTRTWTKHHYEQLFEAAKGHRPLDLDFLVPSVGPLVEVIHDGHNTLPMFTSFQKRFVKLEGEAFPVGGYNHQSMMGVTGPGYFGVTKGEGDHEGELVIDYTKIPKEKPASWPAIRGNDSGIAALVNGNMVDYLRGLSAHVSIGVAYKDGKHRNQWFALVRRDPAEPLKSELKDVPFELRVVERIDEVPEATWNALVREDASPFVEHAWLSCLEEAGCVGGRTGWLPRHLVLYENGEVIAAAPAYLKMNSEGEFVFDWSWADLANRMGLEYYPKLILAVPFTPASGHRVLWHPSRDHGETVAVFAEGVRTITRELGISSAHVLFPEEAEAKLWGASGFTLRQGVQYHWTNQGFRTYEDFLATLPQKKRTQIRRERKQPAMDGLTITTLGPDDLLGPEGAAITDTMFALYTTTVDKYFYGRRYLKKRFFELVRERFASRLAWVVARDREGTIVASAFNVKKNDVLYGRYWGSTMDLPFLHFNVCYYHGVEDAIRQGLRTFNPGAGGEHKRVRGFVPTTTWSAHHIEDARMRGVVDAFLARERKAIAEYVASGGKDD